MAKKLLASVMAFALCLFVSAADMVVKGKNGEDRKINVVDQSKTFLEFKVLSDSTVEVTKKSSYPSYRGHKSITIPEKVRIEGKVYTVTNIGEEAFKYCSRLTSINIPKSVTSIGKCAFDGCSYLTSIKIPEGVTSIGKWAFEGCRGLTSIKIPEGVTSIGVDAFYGCSRLEPELLVYDKGTKCYGWIGDKKKCTEVVIPEGVTSIGYAAFYRCSSLTSINIPEGLTNIGDLAFYGCSSLTNIKIPKSVTSIGYAAFEGCSNLDIVIDNSKKKVKVGRDAFKNCKSVKWLK